MNWCVIGVGSFRVEWITVVLVGIKGKAGSTFNTHHAHIMPTLPTPVLVCKPPDPPTPAQ